jgi:hypothetical protein
MNNALNAIQDSSSNLALFSPRHENPAAAHLIVYLKKIRVQKIFRLA